MSTEKPIIFVSHAAADSKIANKFKSDVEKSFLGLCELFVSSNLDSIQGGGEWIQNIKENLGKAKIFIGLISPVALSRPWIYTEFGAGWIRGIPTISVCHSGLNKSQLPVPLSHFQALDLTDALHLEHLYSQISKAIGCQTPSKEFNADATIYLGITEVERKQRSVRQWVNSLRNWNPDFDDIFQGKDIEILIPSDKESDFMNFKKEMEDAYHLDFQSKGFAMGTRVGMQATIWGLKQGTNFSEFKSII